MNCPTCKKPLHRVTQSASSPLNREQFDAAKAGDWFCDKCPSNGRGNTSFCYFWDREVITPMDEFISDLRAYVGSVREFFAKKTAFETKWQKWDQTADSGAATPEQKAEVERLIGELEACKG